MICIMDMVYGIKACYRTSYLVLNYFKNLKLLVMIKIELLQIKSEDTTFDR